MYKRQRQRLADFKTERDQIEPTIKGFFDGSNEDLVNYAAGLELPENQVTYYFDQHREALQQKRALLAKGSKPTHHEVLAAEERAKSAMANATKETKALIPVLKTRLELINRQIERMKEILRDQEKNIPDPRVIAHQKHELAKAAYEDSHATLRDLETRALLAQTQPPFIIHGWDHQ